MVPDLHAASGSELPPIAVGGVGGSGTRVVAAVLRVAGYDIGSDLNDALDNLWFTLLFKHRGILQASDQCVDDLSDMFVAAMTGNGAPPSSHRERLDALIAADRAFQHEAAWLGERVRTLIAARDHAAHRAPWGWKEPNTHMVIERLARRIPRLRYVHVARSGLDMAFSDNQNQLKLWGPLVLGPEAGEGPGPSLKFWCWAHRRIMNISRTLGPRFMLIRFEDLCRSPESEVKRLLAFVGCPAKSDLVERATALVATPSSLGRAKGHMHAFDAADIDFVRQMGFAVGME